MNTNLSREQTAKTQADNEAKLLELQAVSAFRNGNYADMFKFDALARQRRINSRADFFERNLQAVAAALNPMSKKAVVPTPATNRRVFKLAQLRRAK